MMGLDPRRTFFLVAPIQNTDGSISDFECDGNASRESLDAAVAHAVEEADSAGGEYFIFECRPVKRVGRVRIEVNDVEPLK
jgi:hypothetical protein